MFKYEPKPEYVKRIYHANRWRSVNDLLTANQVTGYTAFCAFIKGYEKVCFHSKTKVREVPVGGYMFPAKMFIETEISQ